MPYIREPGVRRPRSSSRTRGDGGGGQRKPLPTRWDTRYCYRHADGHCPKTEEECGFPHITEEEAKERAGGKVAPKPEPKATSKAFAPVPSAPPKAEPFPRSRGPPRARPQEEIMAEGTNVPVASGMVQ